MSRRVAAALAGVLATCTALVAQVRNDVVVEPLGPRLAAALDRDVPGQRGAVVVSVGGTVVLARGSGRPDLQKGEIGSTHLVDAAGFSGWVLRVVALQLVAQGKLQLADPLRKVLPAWPSDRGAVTVQHLFDHASGLPEFADWQPKDGASSKQAVARIGKCVLVGEPGGRARWSPLNDVLLAAAVEAAGGAKLEELCRKQLWQPLGLADIGWMGERRLDDKKAMDRREKRSDRTTPLLPATIDWTRKGAAGLLASPRALCTLVEAVLDGRAATEAHRKLLLAPLDLRSFRVLEGAIPGSPESRILTTSDAGYRTRVAIDPRMRSVTVVTCDETLDPEPVLVAVGRTLYADPAAAAAGVAPPATGPVASEPVPAADPTAATPARFVGRYRMPSGDELEVTADGRDLAVEALGLQAAERVLAGRWPVQGAFSGPMDQDWLRSRQDRVLLLAGHLVQRDEREAAELCTSLDVARAAQDLWRSLALPKDESPQLAFAGTDTATPPVSWLRVGDAKPQWLRFRWGVDGRISAMERAAAGPQFRTRLVIERADCAAGSAARSKQAIRVTIEGEGDGRVLVWEDGTEGPGGLVACPLVR